MAFLPAYRGQRVVLASFETLAVCLTSIDTGRRATGIPQGVPKESLELSFQQRNVGSLVKGKSLPPSVICGWHKSELLARIWAGMSGGQRASREHADL